MIKKIALGLVLFVSMLSFSQDKNSLLWKISGNGLEKDSYLYGTMHVSSKIAFHLDDVFFESLLKADNVALESDPTFWLDNVFNSPEEMRTFNGAGTTNSRDFYNTPFKFSEPKQQEIMFFLSREDMLLNGIMYRTNQGMQNFQEDTFLDMFIYQTGKRNGKKIFSLEDSKEAMYLVKKAVSSSDFRKKKPDLWLQKKLKDEDYFTLMNNAYRDRNIQFIDSLNESMYSKKYMKNMLFIRNRNMVNSMHSIMKQGSLFSAIGAAHLSGKQGVIAMLKEKGYTVEPLTSKITEKAETLKKSIEDKVINVVFTEQTSTDGFFSAKVPNKLYELTLDNNTAYLCPDLTNGAYVIVTRISTFSKLYEKEEKNKDFDKLLFESIPGEIISKKEITKQGIKGLDIVNLTKTKNYQRYQIFFTPLEVIIFKMNGRKEYVKNYGDQFFESIHFNSMSDKLVTVSPENKGFEVTVPAFHSFTNKNNTGNRNIQSVDSNGNYYFVKEVVLNDVNYLEEDAFELERIHELFYKNLDLEYTKGTFNADQKEYFLSNTKLKKDTNKTLYLKSLTNGGHYYLLGFISNKKKFKDAFFNSFKVTNFNYSKEKFEIKTDTSLYFSANTFIDPEFKNFNGYGYMKKKKSYDSFKRSASYLAKSNEEIFITLNKLHDLESYKNIDSLWNNQGSSINYKNLSRIITRSSSNIYRDLLKRIRLKKSNQKRGKDKNGYQFYSYYLKDSLSSKAIKIKHILSHGAIYDLKTLVDTTYKESEFITTFYNSFKPKDTLIGTFLFKDKTAQFFKGLKNKDSIILEGYKVVNFEKKDIKPIIKLLKDYEFEDNQLDIKSHLIDELGKFKTKKTEQYLEDFYVKSFKNPNNQISIIKSIAKDKTEKSYRKLLNLFEADVPLTSNKFQMTNLIKEIGDSLNLAKTLFPELLNYTTIAEYKEPIYKLLVELLDEGLLEKSNYEFYKKQIINEAKIELKRQLAKNNSTNTYRFNSSNSDFLSVYIKLLFPFRKDKNVQTFYKNLNFVKNSDIKSTLLVLQIQNSEKYNKKTFKELAEELSSRKELYKKLNKINKTNLFPKEYSSKKEIYKAYLFDTKQEKDLKDSIIYIGKRDFTLHNKKFEGYFYKSKAHENNTKSYNKEWRMNYVIVANEDAMVSLKTSGNFNNQNFDTTKPIDEVMDLLVEKFRLKDRKRVNVSTNNYNRSYNNLGF